MKISEHCDFNDPQWAEKEVARVMAKRANGTYYPLPYDDEDWDGDSNYAVLIAPDGSEFCFLSEPEDRIWTRDLKDVVTELNRLHTRNGLLEEALRKLVDHNYDEHCPLCEEVNGLLIKESPPCLASRCTRLRSCGGNGIAKPAT